MARYVKKPIAISAVQLKKDGSNIGEIQDFVPQDILGFDVEKNQYFIKTLEGDLFITLGDYIIKGVQGEFYPCKPDIFKQTYDSIPTKCPTKCVEM